MTYRRFLVLTLYLWAGGIPLRRAWRSARYLRTPPAPPPAPHLTMGDWDAPERPTERAPWE